MTRVAPHHYFPTAPPPPNWGPWPMSPHRGTGLCDRQEFRVYFHKRLSKAGPCAGLCRGLGMPRRISLRHPWPGGLWDPAPVCRRRLRPCRLSGGPRPRPCLSPASTPWGTPGSTFFRVRLCGWLQAQWRRRWVTSRGLTASGPSCRLAQRGPWSCGQNQRQESGRGTEGGS